MTTILLPVDGSAPSIEAVKTAIKWTKGLPNYSLRVLAVQPPILASGFSEYVSTQTVDEYFEEENKRIFGTVTPLLDEANMDYEEVTMTGPVAQSIADYAKNNNIDHIIMGTRGLGSISGLLLGSVTTKVLTLVDIPVTLIK